MDHYKIDKTWRSDPPEPPEPPPQSVRAVAAYEPDEETVAGWLAHYQPHELRLRANRLRGEARQLQRMAERKYLERMRTKIRIAQECERWVEIVEHYAAERRAA